CFRTCLQRGKMPSRMLADACSKRISRSSFPTYYHPYGHHLKASNTPLVHWLFSGETLRKAQNGILEQRGPDFAHFHADPNPHYRLPDLNGITVRRARQLIRGQNWDVVRNECWGVPHSGRRAQTRWLKLISRITSFFPLIPGR